MEGLDRGAEAVKVAQAVLGEDRAPPAVGEQRDEEVVAPLRAVLGGLRDALGRVGVPLGEQYVDLVPLRGAPVDLPRGLVVELRLAVLQHVHDAARVPLEEGRRRPVDGLGNEVRRQGAPWLTGAAEPVD